MTTVAEMLRRFERVSLTELTTDAMEQESDNITQLNRDQMNEGKLSDGSFIKPPYKQITRQHKAIKGQVFNVVTLRDTGEFQSRMFLQIRGTSFDFNSTDWKAPSLEDKYSPLIYGLTNESKQVAWQLCKPHVVREIKRMTGTK